jgi:predicted porin
MTRIALGVTVAYFCLLIFAIVHAADTPPVDVVTLKDGSVIYGEVVEMRGGIWPLFDDRITVSHFQEGYPSLQNTKNFYLTMDNGVRFKSFEGFVSGLQVTTRYNNNPPQGTGDTDNMYLFTLGYSFDTTRKR